MKLKVLFLIIATFGAFGLVNAEDAVSRALTAYRSYIDINNIHVVVPTVVEVPLDNLNIERTNFAVLDRTTGAFEPYYFKKDTFTNEIPFVLNTSSNVGNKSYMYDSNLNTYVDFLLPENAQGRVIITVSSNKPITSSSLGMLLDNNVALPNFIEIRASVDGQSRIIVSKKGMEQSTINFPKTTSSEWLISFTFTQPLRISELRLHQDNATKISDQAVRFLAQPNHEYRVYIDPDRIPLAIAVGESGNLISDKGVLKFSYIAPQSNPSYIIADIDNDGTPDIHDNCISVSNTDQLDINNNGRGDVCDDFDNDGVMNTVDSCPNVPNRTQEDTDGDGIGNVCDKEESRITEKYPWIPWAGIGFAVLVLITLIVLTAGIKRESA